MQQPSLFDYSPDPIQPRPLRLDVIRKYLRGVLRTMRNADYMPWHAAATAAKERDFPSFAGALPEEEAAGLVAEFQAQLTRLKAARL